MAFEGEEGGVEACCSLSGLSEGSVEGEVSFDLLFRFATVALGFILAALPFTTGAGAEDSTSLSSPESTVARFRFVALAALPFPFALLFPFPTP